MGVHQTKLGNELKWEKPPSTHIPYTAHVDKNIVKTKNGDYIAVIKLQGASFDTADPILIQRWHKARNTFFKSIHEHNHAYWSTLIRYKYNEYPEGEFNEGFVKNLNEKYRKYVNSDELFVNELYFTIVVRDITKLKVAGPFAKFLKKDKETAGYQAKKMVVSHILVQRDSLLSFF